MPIEAGQHRFDGWDYSRRTETLGGFKGAYKTSDEWGRWTESYLPETKDGEFHPFQSFVQSMAIPGGVRIERLRADEGRGFTGNDLKRFYRQIGVLLENTSTNTLQRFGLPERVGGTLAVMIQCMLADNDLPTFL